MSSVLRLRASRFGTGKKAKHVKLRFLCVQNLVQMVLFGMAKIDGMQNPADPLTKYVATDVLQRLQTQPGVVSNWLKNTAATNAHDLDDHVAALNAHCPPPARPPHWEWPLCAPPVATLAPVSACAVRVSLHAAGLKSTPRDCVSDFSAVFAGS